jgi:putative serine protease PepD
LLNSNGEIIGINTAIIAGSTGIGFAIPADTVRRVVNDLISIGYVRRPYLGVTQSSVIPLAEVPPLARALGIDAQGVLIMQVAPGSPAAEGGIRGASRNVVVGNYRFPVGGDVIVAFQGRVINSFPELAAAIDRQMPGDRVSVTVVRGNQKMDIPVVLEEAPRPNQ